MTREELYDLVWKMPAVEIARKGGVTPARLRKLCEEFNVPSPPAGYWTKLAHGKAPPRTPLPVEPAHLLSRINSVLRKIGKIPLKIADNQIDDYDIDFSKGHTEAEEGNPSANHQLLSLLDLAISDARPDEEGFITINGPGLPHIRIAPGMKTRARSIYNALIGCCLEKSVELRNGDHGALFAVGAEIFALRMYTFRGPSSPRQGYEGLILELFDPRDFRWSSRNLVGQWRDKPDAPIEASIDEMVSRLLAVGSVIEECRTAVIDHSASEEKQARETAEVAARQRQHAQRKQALLQLADEYAQIQKLKALAEHLAGSGSHTPAVMGLIQELISEKEQKFEPENLSALLLPLFPSDH